MNVQNELDKTTESAREFVPGKAFRIGRNPMRRRRLQRGSLQARRGPRGAVWVARYLEPVIVNGVVTQIHRSRVIGLQAQLSKDQARRILDGWLRPLNDDATPVELVTFQSFYDRWRKDLLPTYRDSTRRFYSDNAKYYVAPTFSGLALADINPRSVQAFINQFAQQYSRSFLKGLRATLNCLFNCAVNWRYLKENPAAKLRLPPGKPVQQAQVLSPAQIDLLVRNLFSPQREMVLLAATTGLRPSELWGLRWQDIDEDGVHVRQRLYRRHTGLPKTAKALRDIPLAPEVYELVNQLRGEPGSFVFHGEKGGPIRSDEVMAAIRPIADKLGLPHFVWQSFRRSAETMMHNGGVPLKTQQAMLGHSNPNMTLHYAEAGQDGKQKAAELLGALTCASVAEVSSKPV